MATLRHVLHGIPREVAKTLRRPSRLRHLGNRVKREALRDTVGAGGKWMDAGPFRTRAYASYEDYVRHQKAKVALKGDLGEYDRRFRAALAARLATHPDVRAGMSVLCLAARIGTEVKAFADAGCFAVGIDLNPAQGDRHVLRGDFHDLQFAMASVDVVFTNSLDHALEIDRLLGEAHRVLKPSGLLLVEAMRGADEGKEPGLYEAFHWRETGDLVRRIEANGFTPVGSDPIDEPWPGLHLRFRRASVASAT